jgi:hypothetical protein
VPAKTVDGEAARIQFNKPLKCGHHAVGHTHSCNETSPLYLCYLVSVVVLGSAASQ